MVCKALDVCHNVLSLLNGKLMILFLIIGVGYICSIHSSQLSRTMSFQYFLLVWLSMCVNKNTCQGCIWLGFLFLTQFWVTFCIFKVKNTDKHGFFSSFLFRIGDKKKKKHVWLTMLFEVTIFARNTSKSSTFWWKKEKHLKTADCSSCALKKTEAKTKFI